MPHTEIITIRPDDDRYPELLKRIADPPAQLYCLGNITLLNSFCVGVVGTRKASDYGRQATADIAGQLAQNGVTIVSGLATGIDSVAHRAALDAKGNTIAVFGTGLADDDIFPVDNVRLAHEIVAAGGLLISEYEEGVHGQPWTFPMRNRIISGLSRGIVVVEADKKSGSLITAKAALDQDRDVFAVPGSIYWPRSVGSNWLIQQGARPVLCAADILESYKMRQIPLPEAALSTSDPVQESILALLRQNGPTHLDTLASQTGFDTPRTMAAIAMLELFSAIQHMGGGIYKTTQ
ncbi:MAG: DNA-processing protein DprA [Patescibacteria group bacterium]